MSAQFLRKEKQDPDFADRAVGKRHLGVMRAGGEAKLWDAHMKVLAYIDIQTGGLLLIISELGISPEGDFEIFYEDDDMFRGHVVIVSGNIEGGISDADMAEELVLNLIILILKMKKTLNLIIYKPELPEWCRLQRAVHLGDSGIFL